MSNKQATRSKRSIKNWKKTLLKIWEYMRFYRKWFVFTLGLVILSAIFSLVAPYLLGVAVDELIVSKNTDKSVALLGGLILIYLSQGLTLVLQNYWMINISQKSVFHMRNDLFYHFQNLSLSFFQKHQQGELMSRMTNDIENVSRTLNSAVIQISTSVITLIGTIAMMIWLSPLLTSFTLMIVPILYFGLKWITKRTSFYFKEQQKQLGDMNGFIEESLSGQHLIKMYGKEAEIMRQFDEKNNNIKTSGYWAQTYTGFIPKLLNMLNNVSFAVIVGLGGIFAIKGYISIGVIVTFTAYARQFTRPLNDLSNQLNMLLSAIAGAERVFTIMNEPFENKDEAEAISLDRINGEVEFDHVSFSYKENNNTLTNLSFHAKKGQTIALVGPTGSGKTTVLNLLSRFYEPDGGQISIDGILLEKIKRSNLRENMAMVLQDSYLFETSILENIRYGKLNASDEDVIIAAKKANAHEFISRLPEGYDTSISAQTSISFGQRQLIAIARALLIEPTLLLLDEATSSIDTITEIKINEALQRLMKNSTTFVIAHRLNTILGADCILLLREGEIVEKGTHKELLEKDGSYAKLYRHQQLTELG
ncbi:ABC transporter ATP-binding protein [Bacillus sp. 2205SS5-2]|uniref:ABC transporter ATP-binding protein n=1 Tax=Bacillus sp. 2205SS5-2 TaxID=3109031 RepID=UPI0030076118